MKSRKPEDNELSRRDFLFMGAAITAAGIPGAIVQDHNLVRNYDTHSEVKEPLVSYPYTHQSHEHYTNVGVRHNQKTFEQHRDFLLPAIDEADIVLLEFGTSGYFLTLKRYAESKNKTVRYIDNRSYLHEGATMSLGITSLVALASGIRNKKILRGLLGASGWFYSGGLGSLYATLVAGPLLGSTPVREVNDYGLR